MVCRPLSLSNAILPAKLISGGQIVIIDLPVGLHIALFRLANKGRDFSLRLMTGSSPVDQLG